LFDHNVAKARQDLKGTSDAHLLANWTLLAAGKRIFSMPRIGGLRSSVRNHMIHHRVQLGVDLRRSDVPVPAIYGPAADEEG
jgi:uncharacterized damage-inducible protein DinB